MKFFLRDKDDKPRMYILSYLLKKYLPAMADPKHKKTAKASRGFMLAA
jgi:hypothetical protein